jgi:hypothetical protein
MRLIVSAHRGHEAKTLCSNYSGFDRQEYEYFLFSGSINKAVDYLRVSELQECASALHILGR